MKWSAFLQDTPPGASSYKTAEQKQKRSKPQNVGSQSQCLLLLLVLLCVMGNNVRALEWHDLATRRQHRSGLTTHDLHAPHKAQRYLLKQKTTKFKPNSTSKGDTAL